MRKILFSGLVCILAFGIAGCRTGMTAEGKPCYELSDSDKEYMVSFARTAMMSGSKFRPLSKAEERIVGGTEPAWSVRYTGDKLGRAEITWDTGIRKVGMAFDGKLGKSGNMINSEAIISVISIERAAPVVDYSGLLSPEAMKRVEEIKADDDAPARIGAPPGKDAQAESDNNLKLRKNRTSDYTAGPRRK